MSEFRALPDIAPATRTVDVEEAHALCPILRREYVAEALLEPDCADIDVHALHQGYLRLFKKRDGRLINNAPVHSLAYANGGWNVQAGTGSLTASLVVNAAGAWADEVAALAGIARIGLTPRRRTAMLIDAPPDISIGGWPFVNDIDEQFYFKPDAGSIFLSPADETPAEPGDAQPEEWDIAAAVDRIEQATTLQVRRLKARWAGLHGPSPPTARPWWAIRRPTRVLLARRTRRLRDPDGPGAVARRGGAGAGICAPRGPDRPGARGRSDVAAPFHGNGPARRLARELYPTIPRVGAPTALVSAPPQTARRGVVWFST